jgi:hypothetical protein
MQLLIWLFKIAMEMPYACSRILLEQYRIQKSWMRILITQTSMLDKMRVIVDSSKVFYFIRQKLYRFTSGW